VGAEAWDAASLGAIDQALALLPARVRSGLGNRALGPLYVTVSSSGHSPSGSQPYGGMANYFSTNDGRNELVMAPGQSTLTVLHELGHAFNLRSTAAASYAQVLLQPEMQGFMAATGWSVLTPSATLRSLRDQNQVAFAYAGPRVWPVLSRDDPLEDFANSFALYFADPAGLRALSPARHAWFEATLGR
jgi:hypothetical protein